MSSLFSIGDDEIDLDDEEFLLQVCETASSSLSSNLKGKNTNSFLRNSSNSVVQEKINGSFSSSNGLRSPLNTLCNNVVNEQTTVNNNYIGSRSKVFSGKGLRLNSIPNGLSQSSAASSSTTLCLSPPSKRLAVEIPDPPTVSKVSSFSVFQRKKRLQDNVVENTSSSRFREIRNIPPEESNCGLQIVKQNSVDIGELQKNDKNLQKSKHSEQKAVVARDTDFEFSSSNKFSMIVNPDRKKASVGNSNFNDKSEIHSDLRKQTGHRNSFCDAGSSSSSAQSMMSPNYSRESINLEIQDNPMAMHTSNKPKIHNTNASTPLRMPQNTPRARKFPGPAGMLPKLGPNQDLNKLISRQPTRINSPAVCKKAIPQISNEDEDFNQDPWVTMVTEFNHEVPSSMRYTVFQALTKAALHELRRGKVPGLCVLVKSFLPTGSDASILLKDATGEIHGTVHRKVLEEYPSQLSPGSGLILRQVSVFSPSSRKHYLNITPGNIVQLYPPGACAATNSQSLVTQLTQSFPAAPAKRISIDDETDGNVSVTKHSKTVEEIVSSTLDDQLLLDAADDDLLVLASQSVTDSGLYNHELQQESFDDLLEGLESEDDLLDEALLV